MADAPATWGDGWRATVTGAAGVVRRGHGLRFTNLPAPAQPSLLPDDRQHIIAVRCPAGHVSQYDLRRVCSESIGVVRGAPAPAGDDLDELLLPCKKGGCPNKTVVRVDCGEYL